MSYRARCESRRSRRRWVLHNRARRAHERTFRRLEAMRPPDVTGNTLADLWAREMYGAAKQWARSLAVYCYGPRFQTWEERYRASKEARRD